MSPQPHLDSQSHRLWLIAMNASHRLNIEPWGITLYLQPMTNYLLDARGNGTVSATDVELKPGVFETPESDSRLELQSPVTIWPTGQEGNAVYRKAPENGSFLLVWESTYPNEVASLLKDQRLSISS